MTTSPQELIIVPVRDFVVFPGLLATLSIERSRSVAAAQEAIRAQRPIGVLLQKDAVDDPATSGFYSVGTKARIVRLIPSAGDGLHLIVHGQERFTVRSFTKSDPFLVAQVEPHVEENGETAEEQAKGFYLKERAIEALELLPQAPPELCAAVRNVESLPLLADVAAGLLDLMTSEKQQILETLSLKDRLERVICALIQRIEVLRLARVIDHNTNGSLRICARP